MDKEVQKIVDGIMEARQTPRDDIAKAFTQSGSATSGITAYSLESPAKMLYPVLTPLRNDIPRIVGGSGIQANWKAVTGINTGNAGFGISEGNRGVVMAQTTADYFAKFQPCGLDNYATFESDLAAQGFQDVKALAVLNLLQAAMIEEEKFDLGGNNSIALGTVGTVTLATSTTGGSIPLSTAVYVRCVALTLEAYLNSTVAGGLPLSANRTLADGTTEFYNRGTSIKSAVNNITTGGGTSTNTVTATVASVNGAVAYAWYWAGSDAAAVLGAITTVPTVTITTAVGTGTQLCSAGFGTDYSQNGMAYDGLLAQIMKSGSGAYVKDLAGGFLTPDNEGGIVEIDAALQSFWDNYRLSPDEIWVSSQEKRNIGNKTMTAATTSSQRFTFASENGAIVGGTSIAAYTNKFALNGSQALPVKLHPFLPSGTVLFRTKNLPYPLSGVTNVVQKLLRRDYYQIEWPLRTRKYEYGVYMDGVLQNYFPPAFGLIKGIGNG